jgi:peptidoglycan biosynthesis protein MviN/MurJ (putative lipid II flippase)
MMLVRPLSHVGLALAESLSLCVKAVMLLALLPDKLRGRQYGRVFRSFAMTAVAGTAMAIVLVGALGVDGQPEAPSLPELAAVAALGGTVYVGLSMLFQPVAMRDLGRILRAGFRCRG